MDEFLEQFLIEARELIAQATADLLALEQSPGDRARLDSAFRAFHTLKGAAGIVDFAAMSELTHAAEDRLAEWRAGTSPVTASLINDLLACLDQITIWLAVMEETGALPEPGQPGPPTPESPSRPARAHNAGRIDAIVKLAGELNVLKNTLGHAIHAADAAALPRLHAQLQRLVSELLTQSLGARVLPLRHVFQRFPRLVRELAAGLGKQVRLVTQGEATEADRAVIEALFEPILHVLRNAVDHGIEPPARRQASGKPELATITLAAAREGDRVVVEITDDGAGIDPSAIRAAAAARGLATPAALAAMPDTEVQALIFAPGFSTSGDVTALSGRGVGMDAVRSAIEALGGRVELRSTPGQGTSVRFILPFSVILTRVLTLTAGGQIFGIPFEAVAETLELAPARIVKVGAAPAFTHRGRTLPLLRLAELLGLPESQASGPVRAVILHQDAALSVQRFGEPLEILLKPAGGLLSGLAWVAGTALLGDGSVLIVLELSELMSWKAMLE